MKAKNTVAVILRRAIAILDAMGPGYVRAAQLIARTNIKRRSVYRYLGVLGDLGYVARGGHANDGAWKRTLRGPL